MIHTATTLVFGLGWFAALSPGHVYADERGVHLWAATLAVWLASRAGLRAVARRRTVVS